MSAPDRSYGARRLQDMVGVTRFLAEVLVVDTFYLAGYFGQAVAPTLVSSARLGVETLSNPKLHRWLLFWSAYLFVTCY